MSDGGNKIAKGNNNNNNSCDEYGRAIAKIAVAQICESVGFDSCQQQQQQSQSDVTTGFQTFQHSTLDVLSQVAIRYILDLGKTAHYYANLAGRTECNALDVVQGLEDLVSLQGFANASDVDRSLAESGTLKEIMHYVGLSEEIPFARDVTSFPVVKSRKQTPSFLQIGETPDEQHIPAWLPAFPDKHTYVNTPVWNERTTDPRTDKIEQARQRRKEERSLLSLQQRLAAFNGSSGFNTVDDGKDGKLKQARDTNPFLAPPLQAGDKDVDVSPVVPPTKAHVKNNRKSLVLETFAPAIGTANTHDVCESGQDDRKFLPNKRPIVNFKLGATKKSLGVPLDLVIQSSRSTGENAQLIVRGDEKDDKKRRAERILKESMENSRELS